MPDSVEWALGRVEGKIDQILAAQAALLLTQATHSERITKVEQWQWKMAGGLAFIALVVPIVIRVLL